MPGNSTKPDSSPTRAAPVRFVDTTASVLFDLLRGLAALVVLFEHGRNLFFVDFPEVTTHRLLFSIPYVMSRAGHQAVIVFFVLSGYFISGAVFRSVDRNQWQWMDYLLRRLVRLWVVLIPALLLCLLWDSVGLHLGRAPALYSGNVPNHMIEDVRRLLTPSIFFGNLLFLQNILVPAFGSDGALWSLANEFWYYLLFPLGFFTLRPATPLSRRLVFGVLFVAIAWFVRDGILGGFPIWLTGTALLLAPPRRFSIKAGRRLRLIAALLYPILFFTIAELGPIAAAMHRPPVSSLFGDYLLTAITFAFLWILLSANQRVAADSKGARASRELARFSYTLYAVHTPFLVFLVSLILGDSRWKPTPAHVLAACGIFVLTLLYAFVLAFVTEFRTDALRTRLERLLRLPTPVSALPSNPHPESSKL